MPTSLLTKVEHEQCLRDAYMPTALYNALPQMSMIRGTAMTRHPKPGGVMSQVVNGYKVLRG